MITTELVIADAVTEINQLHSEILGAYTEICDVGKLTLPKAIRMGELLTKLKKQCGRGKWGQFCAVSFPEMGHATIAKRMQLFKHQGQFLPDGNRTTTSALKEITDNKSSDRDQKILNILGLSNEATVHEIADAANMPYSAVKKRVRKLRDKGAVTYKLDDTGQPVKKNGAAIHTVNNGSKPESSPSPPKKSKIDINDFECTAIHDGVTVKLSLTGQEYKILNQAVSPGCPEKEVETFAIKFISLIRTRYTAIAKW